MEEFVGKYLKRSGEPPLTEEEVRSILSKWTNRNVGERFSGLGNISMLVKDPDGYYRTHVCCIPITCGKEEPDGLRSYCTEENVQRILKYMEDHECYGIEGHIEVRKEIFDEYKRQSNEMNKFFKNK